MKLHGSIKIEDTTVPDPYYREVTGVCISYYDKNAIIILDKPEELPRYKQLDREKNNYDTLCNTLDEFKEYADTLPAERDRMVVFVYKGFFDIIKGKVFRYCPNQLDNIIKYIRTAFPERSNCKMVIGTGRGRGDYKKHKSVIHVEDFPDALDMYII